MGASKYFCGFKTAFFVGDQYDNVGEMIANDLDEFFSYMTYDAELPEGWEFTGTDISGAAGFVVTFDLSGLPTEYDMAEVVNVFDALEEIQKQKKWKEDNIFDADEFENWSIYDVTAEMVKRAEAMWNDGDKDYGNISEALSVDSKRAIDESPWTPALIGKSDEEKLAMYKADNILMKVQA